MSSSRILRLQFTQVFIWFLSSFRYSVDETFTPVVVRYNEPTTRVAADNYTTEHLRAPPGQPSNYYHDATIRQLPRRERTRRLTQRRQALKRFKEIRHAENSQE